MSSLVLLLVAVDKSPAKDPRTALQEGRVSARSIPSMSLSSSSPGRQRPFKVRGIW